MKPFLHATIDRIDKAQPPAKLTPEQTAKLAPRMTRIPTKYEAVCSCCERDARFECHVTGQDFCSYECREKVLAHELTMAGVDAAAEVASGGQV